MLPARETSIILDIRLPFGLARRLLYEFAREYRLGHFGELDLDDPDRPPSV